MATKSVSMRDAISSSREFFGSLDRQGFARWLWAGISMLYTKNTYRGFTPMESWMGFGETSIDDLRTIYQKLVPAEQQPLFRQAIGDILDIHKDDEGDIAAEEIRDLMYLAFLVKAVEIVKVIACVIGYGMAAKKSKQLLSYAISDLKSFDPSPDLREAMLVLINSPNFRDNFIFDVVESLHRHGMVLAGDEAVQPLAARMDIFYRRARALGGKGFANVKNDAMRISWYRIPKGQK
jgi:hypothetical protein